MATAKDNPQTTPASARTAIIALTRNGATMARKLASSGKLKEAVTELHEGLLTCTQRRDRFLWRLHIAQL